VPDRRLADRLGELVNLTESETAALSGLQGRMRTLRRGATLVREHDRHAELFVVRHGMLMSFVMLADGSRQILRFLFPGDILSLSALVYRNSPETIVALDDSDVVACDRSAVAVLMATHPRLCGLLLVINQIERVAMTDRLAALGRTSAKTRIAALLLEIRNSRRAVDPRIATTFTLGLTQEEVGDATGLTSVHVNRMLRELENDRLIARGGGMMTILDEARLARVANYVDRFAGIDLSWLPPAR